MTNKQTILYLFPDETAAIENGFSPGRRSQGDRQAWWPGLGQKSVVGKTYGGILGWKGIPADVFESLTSDLYAMGVKVGLPPTRMGIGNAVSVMMAGERVAREGWNGKGMFLYYVPANSYPAQTDVAKATFGEMVPYRAYVAMKTAQGDVVPWVCSQSDLLETDWVVVS